MSVYVVVKKGVYRHEIIGVFQTPKAAIKAAEGAHKLEPDGYHDWEVLEYAETDKVYEDGVLLMEKIGDKTASCLGVDPGWRTKP